MAHILCKAKGDANPKGKPRVWFTCHPEDFAGCFESVCSDLFDAHDCAVYYTKDMTCPIPEQDWETDLGSNNLFVIPVTYKLLTQPNRAMDMDIPFAIRNHIPILPILMEPGLDAVYSRPDKFGKRQYLSAFSQDITEITYREKLKKYLEGILTDDKTAKRIRGAFDAYIFLSYRKKDRRYANELMRLIHSHPEFRDIAIWYDEYLIPGENFQENIESMLRQSRMFTLLVTPSLLEEPDGKPNFVMDQEYPKARAFGMEILPARMEETDEELLSKKFEGIPPCVAVEDDAVFHQHLIRALEGLADPGNDEDPEHIYLMGLAYLDGIDVETDRNRSLQLITRAAEAGLTEAIVKLYLMYESGQGVELDYEKAAFWVQRLATLNQRTLGEEHPDTLAAWNNLAYIYGKLGKHHEARPIQEKIYSLRRKLHGEKHPHTLTALNNLAYTFGELGAYQKAKELQERAYGLLREMQEGEERHALLVLNNLAETYHKMGKPEKAVELQERVWERCTVILGRNHPDTLLAMHNLAYTYSTLGDHGRALELMEQVHASRCKELGQAHPDTLSSANGRAVFLGCLKQHSKALELLEEAYALSLDAFGESYPESLAILNNLAQTHGKLGNLQFALELQEKLLGLCIGVLGEEHPNSITALSNLAHFRKKAGDWKQALELQEKVYKLRKKTLGELHPDTISSLHDLAICNGDGEKFEKALDLHTKAYTLSVKAQGEEHPDTLDYLESLALLTGQLGNHKKTLKLMDKYHGLCCRVWGEKHPDTIGALKNLAVAHFNTGNRKKAVELMTRACRISTENLGPYHPTTRELQRHLRHICGF